MALLNRKGKTQPFRREVAGVRIITLRRVAVCFVVIVGLSCHKFSFPAHELMLTPEYQWDTTLSSSLSNSLLRTTDSVAEGLGIQHVWFSPTVFRSDTAFLVDYSPRIQDVFAEGRAQVLVRRSDQSVIATAKSPEIYYPDSVLTEADSVRLSHITDSIHAEIRNPSHLFSTMILSNERAYVVYFMPIAPDPENGVFILDGVVRVMVDRESMTVVE